MNRKCPNCGYEPPKPSYQYTGYLKEYLPTILKMLRMGHAPGEVALTLRHLHRIDISTGTITYIGNRYGIIREAAADHTLRNSEIARRYLAGGTTLRKLGQEHGISVERVRGIIIRAQRRAEHEATAQLGYQQATRIEDVPIDALDLPVRLQNCLKNGRWENGRVVGECQTVGDAMRLSDAELLRRPNLGRLSLRAWKQCLADLQREFDERDQSAEAS